MRKLLAATAALSGDRTAAGLEVAVGAACAAGLVLAAAALLPGAGAIDVLACVKFYLAQGCLP
jgi:hypothetical protein